MHAVEPKAWIGRFFSFFFRKVWIPLPHSKAKSHRELGRISLSAICGIGQAADRQTRLTRIGGDTSNKPPWPTGPIFPDRRQVNFQPGMLIDTSWVLLVLRLPRASTVSQRYSGIPSPLIHVDIPVSYILDSLL